MSFIRGCLGILLGLFVVGIIAQILGAVVTGVIMVLGFLVVAGFAAYLVYSTMQRRKQSSNTLAKTLFGQQLPDDIRKLAETAPRLQVEADFNWRVVHSEDFGGNFELLLQEYEGRDGDTVELFEAVLACEPANPLNPNAIAVAWGGVLVGYLAKIETAELFKFIMEQGGIAKCAATLDFNIAENRSKVRVNIARPFRVQL